MKFLDKIMGRAAVTIEPAATQAIPPASRPIVNQPALDAASKRIGMWVTINGAAGILTGARADGSAEVTIIRADGGTNMVIGLNDTAIPDVMVVTFDALKQARIHEIPESRRGDPAQLATFGYQ